MGDVQPWYGNTIDINILLNEPGNILPGKNRSMNDNFNRCSRFLLLIGAIMSILTGNIAYLLFSILLLYLCGYMYKNYGGFVFSRFNNENCQNPTPENPMANVLLSDYKNAIEKKPACKYDDVKNQINNSLYDAFNVDENDFNWKNNSQRQFFSMPSTTIPNDRDAFLDFVSGGQRYKKMCKEDAFVCTGREGGISTNSGP